MIMKKVPFVTNEQLKSILEKYPSTTRKASVRMRKPCTMHFPGTKVSASILL